MLQKISAILPYSMSRATGNMINPQVLRALTNGYAIISCLYHTWTNGDPSWGLHMYAIGVEARAGGCNLQVSKNNIVAMDNSNMN